MIFLKERRSASLLAVIIAAAILPFVMLGGCGLDGTGGGSLIYLEADGKLYCPAPRGWEVFGNGSRIEAKAGYGRKTKKKKCSALLFGDGTFIVYGEGKEKTLLCRCDGDLPTDADAKEEYGIVLRTGERDTRLDPESAGNLIECLCDERLTDGAETLSDVGLVFAVFPSVGAMKLLGTVRSVKSGGFALLDGNDRCFLLPDDFAVDTFQ